MWKRREVTKTTGWKAIEGDRAERGKEGRVRGKVWGEGKREGMAVVARWQNEQGGQGERWGSGEREES